MMPSRRTRKPVPQTDPAQDGITPVAVLGERT